MRNERDIDGEVEKGIGEETNEQTEGETEGKV